MVTQGLWIGKPGETISDGMGGWYAKEYNISNGQSRVRHYSPGGLAILTMNATVNLSSTNLWYPVPVTPATNPASNVMLPDAGWLWVFVSSDRGFGTLAFNVGDISSSSGKRFPYGERQTGLASTLYVKQQAADNKTLQFRAPSLSGNKKITILHAPSANPFAGGSMGVDVPQPFPYL